MKKNINMKRLKTYKQLFEVNNVENIESEFNVGDIVVTTDKKNNQIISLIYDKHENLNLMYYDTLPIGMIMWNEFVEYTELIPKKHLILTSIAKEIDEKIWKKIVIRYEQYNHGDVENPINRIFYITKIKISGLLKYKKIAEEIKFEKDLDKFNI